MEYRLNKNRLLEILGEWNRFLKRKVHLTEIDMSRLIQHFYSMISYDVVEDRLKPNIDHYLELLREKGLYD
ncbi:hypothetical protein ACFL2E_11365 [Thermodesulfobacteriota bacterium]